MITWIVALVLIGLLSFLGKFIGLVRMGCITIGVYLGIVLGLTLNKSVQPYMEKINAASVLGIHALPPLLILLVTMIVMVIVGQVLHIQVLMFFKKKRGEAARAAWDDMQKKVGIPLGGMAGVGLTLVFIVYVYTLGYWSSKVDNGGSNHQVLQVLTKLHGDLKSSGFRKLAAALQPLPDAYYKAADVAGLVFENPQCIPRLISYPGLFWINEMAETQALRADSNFTSVFERRGDLWPAMMSAPVWQTLQKESYLSVLKGFDYMDLFEYLQTGVSPAYQDEPIVGKWNVLVLPTMIRMKSNFPNAPIDGLVLLKRFMDKSMRSTTVLVGPNKQIIIKAPLKDAQELANILRVRPRALKAGSLSNVANGEWQNAGTFDYQVTFAGNTGPAKVRANGEELELDFYGGTLILRRDN